MSRRSPTVTGGRPATSGVIPGRYALSVGNPHRAAPPGWEWTPLTDVARLESGHTPSRRHPEYWGGDIPWIGIRDATENHGRVLHDTAQHVTQDGIDHSSARVLPANTVCLSRTASVGYVVVMGRPMATSQDFVNWVCGPRIDAGFLKYVLLAERDSFAMFASGTTHQTIYFPEVKALHICLPPLEEQRRIARLLGALDDKIDLNRERIASLVELCRHVFEGRLNAVPAADDLGPVTIGDVVEVLETGGRPQGGVAAYSDGVPSIGAESITGLGEFDFSKTKYVPVDYYAAMRRGKLENRDVLLYKDGGRPGLFEPHVTMVGDGFPFETAAINEHVYRLRARPPYTQTLLYLWLSGAEAMNEMRVKGTGVAIPGLNSTALRSIHVPTFRPDAARELDRILEPFVARVLHAARESRILAQSRDLLLPRLLGVPEMQ